MSTFFVTPLTETTNIQQEIRITKGTSFINVRPRVFKNDVLTSGDYLVRIYEGVTLLKESKTISYTEINSAIGQYAHGFLRFDFDSHVRLNHKDEDDYTTYIIEVACIGASTNLELGWIRPTENYLYGIYGTETPTIYDFEIYSSN